MQVSKKIERYREYEDDDEKHLYYFYVGYKCALENGYNKIFLEALEENQKIQEVASYLKGYLEAI